MILRRYEFNRNDGTCIGIMRVSSISVHDACKTILASSEWSKHLDSVENTLIVY
jgi:hypothetical protein